MKTRRKKFWYLWAESHARIRALALGPFSTREEVDRKEQPFRNWARKRVKGWDHWCKTGGICYSTNQGIGKANDFFYKTYGGFDHA